MNEESKRREGEIHTERGREGRMHKKREGEEEGRRAVRNGREVRGEEMREAKWPI